MDWADETSMDGPVTSVKSYEGRDIDEGAETESEVEEGRWEG